MKEKHEFSLYYEGLKDLSLRIGKEITINNEDLYHRIVRILRLKESESCILFDAQCHILVTFQGSFKKNSVTFTLIAVADNQILQPKITFLLPLLKREALHDAIYSLVEGGASTIQLIDTKKVHQKWGGKKEYERLHKVMIAAAEQSKNYALPELLEPQSFEDILQEASKAQIVFFDPEGHAAFSVIEQLKKGLAKELILMVGPEGDLTNEEKEVLKKHNALFCRLGPTVLRAQQAVVVALGLMRSLL
ncbi:MAG: 16S rRNA (uracil(1498)-N(3))-methyltransferase [Candidatus Babeliales bacterium]